MTPQYRTIAAGAAWLDVSARGRIRFDGPDAASFLHALVTNDVENMPAGRGVYTAWLTPQGRMITDMRLMRDDGRLFAEVPDGLAAPLAKRFDQLIFSENVRVFDDTASTRQVIVFGEQASRVVGEVAGRPAEELATLPVLGHFTVGDLRIVRTDAVALPNYSIWMPAGNWHSVTAALNEHGATALPAATDGSGSALFEALRIESGRPRFGIDMTTDTIPLEAGLLDRAISMTKGCYVGQEVIVRILHRGGGRVAKHLAQLVADEGVTSVPAVGTPILDDGRDVGAITSAALGPATGRVVALGYVHRDSAQAGRRLALGSGQEVVLAALTF
jgi:folate-binding protein YgfZ